MWYDYITAFFELGAAAIMWLNVRALLRDKEVAGVSPWPTAFFMLWSVWNLVLFPLLGMWLAAAATVMILVSNGAWMALYVHYGWKTLEDSTV